MGQRLLEAVEIVDPAAGHGQRAAEGDSDPAVLHQIGAVAVGQRAHRDRRNGQAAPDDGSAVCDAACGGDGRQRGKPVWNAVIPVILSVTGTPDPPGPCQERGFGRRCGHRREGAVPLQQSAAVCAAVLGQKHLIHRTDAGGVSKPARDSPAGSSGRSISRACPSRTRSPPQTLPGIPEDAVGKRLQFHGDPSQ